MNANLIGAKKGTVKKSEFISIATAYGVTAHYSGKENVMYIGGDDTKAKAFIRVRNLKGSHPFTIKQCKV